MSNLLNKILPQKNDGVFKLYSNRKMFGNNFKSLKNMTNHLHSDGLVRSNTDIYQSLNIQEPSQQRQFSSQKKLQTLLFDPKQNADLFRTSNLGRYKDLMSQKEHKIYESLRKMYSQTRPVMKSSSKIKNLQFPLYSISQSLDIDQSSDTNIKKIRSLKMPDLIKIKLRKQLQTIQKTKNKKGKIFEKDQKYKKSKHKAKKPSVSLVQCDYLQPSNYSKKHIQKPLINEKNFENMKIRQKSKKIQYRQKDKKSLEKKSQLQKNFSKIDKLVKIQQGNKNPLTKYSFLLNSVDQQSKRLFQNRRLKNTRLRTQSWTNTQKIIDQLSHFQLQGVHLQENSELISSYLLHSQKNVDHTKKQSRKKEEQSMSIKQTKSSKQISSEYQKYKTDYKNSNHSYQRHQEISPWVDEIHSQNHGFEYV